MENNYKPPFVPFTPKLDFTVPVSNLLICNSHPCDAFLLAYLENGLGSYFDNEVYFNLSAFKTATGCSFSDRSIWHAMRRLIRLGFICDPPFDGAGMLPAPGEFPEWFRLFPDVLKNARSGHWMYTQPDEPPLTDSRQKKPIPSRLRFAVLQRDQFACRYCGRRSPEVQLHIDHVYPESEGGRTTLDNLAVSCADCNFGKGKAILGVEE